ncbi:flavocytochrome c [Limosilactobacillus difficilis]|uniref:flavocytochrome c n=1 Tax=Limosilactobacillus difficilis TaxID=2991838 RepID=UPI0024B936FE|nr:flavocytochrome c [Limosilactobacillus difficilis]
MTELAAKYDVLVIGAGGAGMTAALQAEELGAQVAVLEKEDQVGGNTSRASSGMNAAETMVQLDHGVIDSMANFYWETMKGGGRLNDPQLLNFFVHHANLAIDWLTQHGMPLTGLTITGGMSRQRTHRPSSTAPVGGYLVKGLRQQLAEHGIPVFTKTKVTALSSKLVAGRHFVDGVTVQTAAGERQIQASVVVLATGGFGANAALISRLRPDLAGYATTNQEGAQGDGLKLGEMVGAASRDLSWIQVHPTVQQDGPHAYLIAEAVRGEGAILVNAAGRRFVNELTTRRVVSNAITALPEHSAYLIFDAGVRSRARAIDFYDQVGLVETAAKPGDLAKKIGLPAARVEKTVDHWNQQVAADRDQDFGRQSLAHALTQAPYYAIHVAPAVHYTMGGLHIDPQTRVLDANGNVIAGLLAAGEVTGGLHGNNRIGGNSIAETVVFGRQAGIQAVKDLRK